MDSGITKDQVNEISSNQSFTFYIKHDGRLSIAELTFDDYVYLNALATHGIRPPGRLLYFNRLKAMPEGIGLGTHLMNRLEEVCDRESYTVWCDLNPYGSLDYEQLKTFYTKFGFIEFGLEGALIRLPKGKSDES
jgi:GNAT superfamily N-acetyltransferase